MRYPDPLPSPLNQSSFTVKDALERGLTRGRLRNGNVTSIGHGLRISAGAADNLMNRVRPYTRVAPKSAASHSTAAELWSLRRPYRMVSDRSIHISRPAETTALRRKGVTGHQSKFCPGEVVCVDGLFLTSRERTWLDLAEMLSIEELVVIADQIVRIPRPSLEGRSEPYTTREELGRLLDRHRGKQGIRKAREALQLSRVGSDSAPETQLRLAIGRARLPEPALNEAILDPDGVSHHEPDLSYPAYRIAIEYEGAHHGDTDQVVRDIDREEHVSAAGWMQVRISRRHMRSGAQPAIAKIRTALTTQGWRPKP